MLGTTARAAIRGRSTSGISGVCPVIAELCFAAKLRHRPDPRHYADPIVYVAEGLIEMRQAGVIRRLYIDAGVIRISFGTELMRLDLESAARLIRVFRERMAE